MSVGRNMRGDIVARTRPREARRIPFEPRRSPVAIHPRAFFELFAVEDEPRENTEIGGCVVVDIKGPLEQHEHYYFDSYEAVTARVAAACDSSARAVILRFDSPGGDVAGSYEAAREIRDLCAAAGKALYAYVDGDCCSAAYALACVAQSITLGESGLVGSIGILCERADYSAQLAGRGIRVAFITSGARKADGHEEQPITEAELAQTQAIVDSMAASLFELVGAHRGSRGLTAEACAALQAKVFHGSSAVAAGLVDEIGTLNTLLAAIASPTTEGRMADKKDDKDDNASAYDTARAALEEAAKGDDANAKAAKRALAALDAEGGDDEPKAEGGDDEPAAQHDEPDGDEPAAPTKKETPAAAAMRAALKAQAQVHTLTAQLKQRDERDERERLIASRSDLAPEMVALLRKAPIALVRETIEGLPRGTATAGGTTSTTIKNPRARAAGATPTRGQLPDEPNGAAQLPPDEKHELDVRMGLVASSTGIRNTPYKLELGVPVFKDV